jgi:hypothetical protein
MLNTLLLASLVRGIESGQKLMLCSNFRCDKRDVILVTLCCATSVRCSKVWPMSCWRFLLIWSHFVVMLKSDLDPQQLAWWSGFAVLIFQLICPRLQLRLNFCSTNLKSEQIYNWRDLVLISLYCATQVRLNVKQTSLGHREQFVEQKLTLSSKCYQIHRCQRYNFGHTLLCFLSQTWMLRN